MIKEQEQAAQMNVPQQDLQAAQQVQPHELRKFIDFYNQFSSN